MDSLGKVIQTKSSSFFFPPQDNENGRQRNGINSYLDFSKASGKQPLAVNWWRRITIRQRER